MHKIEYKKNTYTSYLEAFADGVRQAKESMNKVDLGKLFDNKFDCCADTWEESESDLINGRHELIEGDTVPAMTKEVFIVVVNEILNHKTGSQPIAE